MRLYEFTNPNEYLVPETGPTERLRQTKIAGTDDTADTVRPLKKKSESKIKATDTL